MGPPHVVRVARAGAECDDIGSELRDETDQPDRLRGLLGAELGVGVDDVEGRRDAGDAHAGDVECLPNGGDLRLVGVASKGRAPDRGKVPVRECVAGSGDRRGNLLGCLPTEDPREDAQTLREPPGAVVLGVVHSFTSDPLSTAVAVASTRRTAASPSRTSGTGWPPARMVRANAST